MHLISRNIDTIFPTVLDLFLDPQESNHFTTDSRNGPVWQLKEPLTLTYTNPLERLLYNPIRNCNPFFHLAESLWMLAGRKDIDFLTPYNSRMAEYSDDGLTQRAAYGHRWVNYPIGRTNQHDQLERVIHELTLRPESRRAVITMWDPTDTDYLGISSQDGSTKDMPCNTQAYVQIVKGKLELTITNRSNDIMWGMLGANVVHFSFLLEYLAASLRRPVGRMHQFSTNPHIYTEVFSRSKLELMHSRHHTKPTRYITNTIPLTANPNHFIERLRQHLQTSFGCHTQKPHRNFLDDVWLPMSYAWEKFKDKTNPARHDRAIALCQRIMTQDWRLACTEYILRAKAKFQQQNPYAYIEDVQDV